MWHKRDKGGRHRTRLTHVVLASTLAPRGFESSLLTEECQNTRSREEELIRFTLMVECWKHGEEALGGFDNTALSKDPQGYLCTAIPSAALHVFLITWAFPQAVAAELSGQWLVQARRL